MLLGAIDIAPGRVSYGKLVLSDKPDKELFKALVWTNKNKESVYFAWTWVTRAPP